MRRFWTSANRDEVTHFAALLKSQGIDSSIETIREGDWEKEGYGSLSFSLWIADDGQIPRAKELFSTFSFEIDSPRQKVSKPTPLTTFIRHTLNIKEKEPEAKKFSIATFLLTLLCILIFIGTAVTTQADTLSPFERYLLFEDLTNPPFWGGILSFVSPHDPSFAPQAGLLFEAIRHGQLWRLCTPILLHANLVHIVFNLMWVIFLGAMIEPRIGARKYLFLIAIIAAISNTAQYFISGPAFLGISGVICGMAGFVSTRQRIAPWEAYPMPQNIYQFLIFWIWLLIALSALMFLLSFQGVNFAIQFGNTAHVIGLLTGKILGRFSFFSSAKRPAVIKFV